MWMQLIGLFQGIWPLLSVASNDLVLLRYEGEEGRDHEGDAAADPKAKITPIHQFRSFGIHNPSRIRT